MPPAGVSARASRSIPRAGKEAGRSLARATRGSVDPARGQGGVSAAVHRAGVPRLRRRSAQRRGARGGAGGRPDHRRAGRVRADGAGPRARGTPRAGRLRTDPRRRRDAGRPDARDAPAPDRHRRRLPVAQPRRADAVRRREPAGEDGPGSSIATSSISSTSWTSRPWGSTRGTSITSSPCSIACGITATRCSSSSTTRRSSARRTGSSTSAPVPATAAAR